MRDSLNPEVLRRAGEKGVAGQMPAAAAVLREKSEEEPRQFLWPLLLGWQNLRMSRFEQSIEAFQEAISRDEEDVRGYYGAGNAYFEASQAKQNADPGAPVTGMLEEMTFDNLLHEANRNFRRAMELATEKDERDKLRNAMTVVDKALAKKAGRL
jgi:hypothetical protein